MCILAQTPYRRPSVRPSVCLCTCKSVHMHTSPRLYLCMYIIMYVYVCVGVCARANVRARVCLLLSYTNVQVHTRDFSWACKRVCGTTAEGCSNEKYEKSQHFSPAESPISPALGGCIQMTVAL